MYKPDGSSLIEVLVCLTILSTSVLSGLFISLNGLKMCQKNLQETQAISGCLTDFEKQMAGGYLEPSV